MHLIAESYTPQSTSRQDLMVHNPSQCKNCTSIIDLKAGAYNPLSTSVQTLLIDYLLQEEQPQQCLPQNLSHSFVRPFLFCTRVVIIWIIGRTAGWRVDKLSSCLPLLGVAVCWEEEEPGGGGEGADTKKKSVQNNESWPPSWSSSESECSHSIQHSLSRKTIRNHSAYDHIFIWRFDEKCLVAFFFLFSIAKTKSWFFFFFLSTIIVAVDVPQLLRISVGEKKKRTSNYAVFLFFLLAI